MKNYMVQIIGLVQGLGFRPFIYRLVHRLGIQGWVSNDGQGVSVYLSGVNKKLLEEFLRQVEIDKPPLAEIHSISVTEQDSEILINEKKFEIKVSASSVDKFSQLLPDLAPCKDCLQELLDPNNRRYLYPFINCTNCGPRYSIIEDVPYDRAHTTMRKFKLCSLCAVEYENPLDRRFHAEPIACEVCGPKLQLWHKDLGIIAGEKLSTELFELMHLLAQGKIIALKGVGGFQLIVDATNTEAINNLRIRKQRPKKPFAVMMLDLAMVNYFCDINIIERDLLSSYRSPIVLVKKRLNDLGLSEPSLAKTAMPKLANNVAPENPYLGAMLPSSPLHYLILKYFGRPLIVTSGNISDEPICISNDEAKIRLTTIADYFLLHNREIVRPLDDSIVQVIHERVMMLRVGRGYAPQYFNLPTQLNQPIMALGAQLKNTIAFYNGKNIHMSQHFGDLDKVISQDYFAREVQKIFQFYKIDKNTVEFVSDLHPDYYPNQWLNENTVMHKYPPVQHHKAHLVGAAAEFELHEPYLGIVWDGTGYGEDHCIWGGEFFYDDRKKDLIRIGNLRPFRLVAGASAIRNPWKLLFGICDELSDLTLLSHIRKLKNNWTENEEVLLLALLNTKQNCPLTTSMGRLFDAISSLLTFTGAVEFEAQAAMSLEFEAMLWLNPEESDDSLLPWVKKQDYYILDWEPMIRKILSSLANRDITAYLAYSFHSSLARCIFDLAQQLQVKNIVLSGGVFQNRLLLQEIFKRSKINGIKVNLPQRYPVNDGGIALGQLLTVINQEKRSL